MKYLELKEALRLAMQRDFDEADEIFRGAMFDAILYGVMLGVGIGVTGCLVTYWLL